MKIRELSEGLDHLRCQLRAQKQRYAELEAFADAQAERLDRIYSILVGGANGVMLDEDGYDQVIVQAAAWDAVIDLLRGEEPDEEDWAEVA